MRQKSLIEFAKMLLCRRKARGIYCIYFGVLLTIPVLFILDFGGAYEYAMQTSFRYFKYPLEVDMRNVVRIVKQNGFPGLQPINEYPFTEVITNNEKCQGSKNGIFVLLAVKSAINHFERRGAIRNSWGGVSNLDGKEIRTIFMLGARPYEDNLQEKVLAENAQHGDIIQDNFFDEYFNNTFKMMMGFRWATTHCRNAQFILFVDDDYYISTHNLIKYLKEVERPSKNSDFIAGFIWNKSIPMRHHQSKWYVTLAEYPFDHWPPYPTAGSFVISMKTALDFNVAFHYTKYMRFDDVFVGIVAWKMHVKPVHNYAFQADRVDPLKESYLNTIASHGFEDPKELVELWRSHQKQLNINQTKQSMKRR